MSSLQIKYVSPDELRPLRRQTPVLIRRKAKSGKWRIRLRRFGFTNSNHRVGGIIRVIAGPMVGWLAAKLLGLTSLPVVISDKHDGGADRRAYVIRPITSSPSLPGGDRGHLLGDRIAIPSGRHSFEDHRG